MSTKNNNEIFRLSKFIYKSFLLRDTEYIIIIIIMLYNLQNIQYFPLSLNDSCIW